MRLSAVSKLKQAMGKMQLLLTKKHTWSSQENQMEHTLTSIWDCAMLLRHRARTARVTKSLVRVSRAAVSNRAHRRRSSHVDNTLFRTSSFKVLKKPSTLILISSCFSRLSSWGVILTHFAALSLTCQCLRTNRVTTRRSMLVTLQSSFYLP